MVAAAVCEVLHRLRLWIQPPRYTDKKRLVQSQTEGVISAPAGAGVFALLQPGDDCTIGSHLRQYYWSQGESTR